MAWAPPVPVRKHSAAPYVAPTQYAPPTPVYGAPPPVPVRPAPPPIPDDGLIRVRALFDFPGTADGDLVFKKGDIIIVTQKLAPGWWEGKLGNEIGIFPLPYVEDCIPQNTSPRPPGLTSSSGIVNAAPAAPPPVPSRQTAAYIEAQRAILALSVTAQWHRSMIVEEEEEGDYEEEETDEEPPVASASVTDVVATPEELAEEAERQREEAERQRQEAERARAFEEQLRLETLEAQRKAEEAWREEQKREELRQQEEQRRLYALQQEEMRRAEEMRREEERRVQLRRQEELRQQEIRREEQRRAEEARREEQRKEQLKREQEEELRRREAAELAARRAKQEEEQRRLLAMASEMARKEQERIMEEARRDEERRKQERERREAQWREAEEKRKREEAKRREEEEKRRRDDETRRKQEEQRRAEEAKRAEEQKRIDEQRRRERLEEAKRIEEQRKQREAQWKVEEQKRQEELRKQEEAKRREAKQQEEARKRTAKQEEENKRHLPICVKCNKGISGRALIALDKNYHPSCFTCQRCSKPLSSAFSPINGAPHCSDCARAIISATRRPTGNASNPPAQSSSSSQSQSLSPSSSTSGNPPAQKRHSKRVSQRVMPSCAKCSKPLSGAVIDALGKSFHEACFGCTQCGSAVTSTFVQIGGQPFCDPCAKARFQKELRARSAQPENSLSSSSSSVPARSSQQSATQTSSASSALAPQGGASQWRGGLAHGTQALLEWCQANTRGYAGVDVRNWTTSWQDGLALCALIHHFYPTHINFNSLRAANKMENIKLGIATAKRLGVPELLDAEDFGIEKLSMCTYISELYKKLELKQ